MLLCKPFAIEGIEGRHFEPRWVPDCVPLHWIGPSSSDFLPNSGGLEGSDLLLKSLHPMTGVTISSLTLRLYFALVVGLDLRLDFCHQAHEENGSEWSCLSRSSPCPCCG